MKFTRWEPMGASSVAKRQHLVSQVLLARWTIDGELISFDLRYPKSPSKRRSPSAVAYKHDFVQTDSQVIEARWQRVETRANAMFRDLDAGSLFDRPDHVDDVKDLIALHLARSNAMDAMWLRTIGSPRSQERLGRIAAILEQPGAVDALFEHFTGLASPGGPQARQIVTEHLAGLINERFGEGGITFAERVVESFEEFREWLRPKRLQIVRPATPSDQFLISDTPAQPLDFEGRRVGFQGGVRLNGNANTVILPLGPGALVAASNGDEYIEIQTHQVELLNEALVASAQRHVYASPDSALAHWVPAAAARRAALLTGQAPIT
jgi:hypothetical protein